MHVCMSSSFKFCTQRPRNGRIKYVAVQIEKSGKISYQEINKQENKRVSYK
jgi:hypothetical protein